MIERLVPAGRGRLARIRCSERTQGDFRGDAALSSETLEPRRQALMTGPWTWLRQVHGADVRPVSEPGAGAGSVGDGAVTAVPGAVLALYTADCAPVVVTGGGALGVAHAGWPGILAGVIDEMIEGVRSLAADPGPSRLRAVLGPLIRPASYEFGADDLDTVAAACGPQVRAVTAWGTPALNLAAAVCAALTRAGVSEIYDLGFDTARDRFFSHRVRGETARQATVARLEPEP